jgi:cell surface protein SprA
MLDVQFKIPVYNPETLSNISDFRTGFMRMFMTGFTNNTMRFGALDLIRGDWRGFTNTDFNDTNVLDDNTTLDVLAVNVQENNQRCPVIILYSVQREQLF